MVIPDRDQRAVLRAGLGIILSVAALILLIWLGGYLPGPIGDAFSFITGALWTPFIMEPTLFLIGLFAVIILNNARRKKEGSELVYLETVNPPHDSKLPPPSRSSITTEKPIPPTTEELISTIEGAMDLNEHQQATRLLLELPQEELETERILAVRLQLAKLNRDPNHIRGLSKKLRELNPEHPALA